MCLEFLLLEKGNFKTLGTHQTKTTSVDVCIPESFVRIISSTLLPSLVLFCEVIYNKFLTLNATDDRYNSSHDP